MYEFNTRFKDSLDTLAAKQMDTLRVLGRYTPTDGGSDDDVELHYCKIIGMLLADAFNDTKQLASFVFAIQDKQQQHAMFYQIKWRVNEAMWIAKTHRELGERMDHAYTSMLDVYHNSEYSALVFQNNPDDFRKFDRAEDRLEDFFKGRVTKTEPND